LGVESPGLRLQNSKARFSNQESQIDIQNSSLVVARAEREGAERDSSSWKVGRHPYPIYGRFSNLGTLFECSWGEKSRVG